MSKKEISNAVTTAELVEAAAAAVPERISHGWRDVALFVCEKCGKEKRGQAHRNMVCKSCVEA